MRSDFQLLIEATSRSLDACSPNSKRCGEAAATVTVDRKMAKEPAVSRYRYPPAPVSSDGPHALAWLVSPKPDPWWQAIPSAAAWVMQLFIEGFAAYGAAMHPSCF